MRYKAPKGTVVGGLRPDTSPISIEFKSGTYSTNDPDEIALLDEVAELQANPVGFDPKEE